MLNTNKPYKIYADILEDTALKQFEEALAQPFAVKGALMPDAHTWYVLPIGWVMATKDYIVPAWVWYDIGCWVSALETGITREELEKSWNKEKIFNEIYEYIPTWPSKNSEPIKWNYENIPRTEFLDNLLKIDKIYNSLGTLWSWNHFIEIWYDTDDMIWIIIHSGSRSLWHHIATEYMKKAYIQSMITEDFIKNLKEEFEQKNKDFKKYNYEKFLIAQDDYVNKNLNKILKEDSSFKMEWNYWLDINSQEWLDYIQDLNFALEFALQNRERMIERVYKILLKNIDTEAYNYYLDIEKEDIKNLDIKKPELWFEFIKEPYFINRNHNHAELNSEWLWIHRKWATHAEDWMYGVIPWNMKDWTFIIRWKWNPDSLSSSSHGAWRILSRVEAQEQVNMNDFEKSMEGIVALIDEGTKDESAFAYKNIFDVMEAQSDLVDTITHIKPLINIKAKTQIYK